jgi:hypothetical protein
VGIFPMRREINTKRGIAGLAEMIQEPVEVIFVAAQWMKCQQGGQWAPVNLIPSRQAQQADRLPAGATNGEPFDAGPAPDTRRSSA